VFGRSKLHLRDLGVGGRIISNWILEMDGVSNAEFWLRLGTSGGLF